MKKALSLLLLSLCIGCGSVTYVPESQIELFSDTPSMGQKYPYIIVDGQRLEFNKQRQWYFYENTDIPALWLEYPGPLGVVERILSTVTRYNAETRTWQDYKDGGWVDRDPAELPPVAEEAGFYIDNVHSFVK
jgi:hypothetical protein